jgi:hypothetical protein
MSDCFLADVTITRIIKFLAHSAGQQDNCESSKYDMDGEVVVSSEKKRGSA